MGKILKKPVDNNRKSRITSAKAISVLIVVLWVLSGALVRGLQVKTTYGKIQMPEEELEKLSGSEDSPYKEMARQVFDNSFGKQI